MRVRVLGSAAGGGFPQWDCGCVNCVGVRQGTIAAQPRTQECAAVSADEQAWVLLNVSPEIRQQIESFPALHPRGPRHSPVRAIILTNGDLDHCLGLLSLRESHRLVVYATERVRAGFTAGNVLYRTLQRFPEPIIWRRLPLGTAVEIKGRARAQTGLTIEAIAAPGKPSVHLEGRSVPHPEDNVGLRVRQRCSGRELAYFPSVAAVTPAVAAAIVNADCVFFDGTFWASDELSALGLADKRAEQTAHAPVGGPRGSLALLAAVPAPRKIFIHMNNTSPLLRDDAPERAAVEAAGWEVACDGMEIAL